MRDRERERGRQMHRERDTWRGRQTRWRKCKQSTDKRKRARG